MTKLKTIKPFYDLHEHVDRRLGDVFDVTEERAERLQVLLPNYVEVVVEDDYASMTTQQLTALAKERNVLPKKGRLTKSALIEALSKE